ncbi:hypothetical protein PVK06_016171 [Gossypium arboreum]|uniref:Plastocyanin-like domain-containing protein n=1 Tax=Gossypium arboreum TaxID=29729 RepID=A0ABR0Q001_GOSAR|nr:hypothetical protein PVK06_016171 [Gossypium arboreum]
MVSWFVGVLFLSTLLLCSADVHHYEFFVKCVSDDRFAASLNNVSFVSPRIDILQAYYRNITGVFTQDFPFNPPVFYNFTGNLTDFNTVAGEGTRAIVVNYGDAVEMVLQTTRLGAGGSHPIHLHGFSFYWVGIGTGNFNNETDPSTYNLVDPPLINTVHSPAAGWVALRFFAKNPGGEKGNVIGYQGSKKSGGYNHHLCPLAIKWLPPPNISV